MKAKQESHSMGTEVLPASAGSGRRILVERASPLSIPLALVQNGNDPACYTEAGKKVIGPDEGSPEPRPGSATPRIV